MGILGSVFNFLGFGRYNLVLPTVAPGAAGEVQIDQRGRLRVAVEASVDSGGAAARSRYRTDSAASSGEIASPTPKKVVEVMGQNRSSNARYFHLYDLATSQGAGDAPKVSYRVEGNGFFNLGYQSYPLEFSAGVVWAVSSDPEAFAAAGSDKFFVEIVLQDVS